MSNEIRSMDEYKTMHALCIKFYYQNMSDEERDKLRAKQRVRNRERYRTDPEYREKVKMYMKGYNERKKAAQKAEYAAVVESECEGQSVQKF
jgi:hypothetical protein